MDTQDLTRRLERLVAIGIELSSAKNLNDILAHILESAMELTRADGGTLYLVRGSHLTFEIIRNRSLGIAKGGSGEKLAIDPIPLHLPDGRPNLTAVSAAAALQKRTFNLEDAYTSRDFDFSGTRRFDQLNHYRSQSFLTVPLINHENEVIGVLQLINALTEDGQSIRPFDAEAQFLVESLASQAAVVLNNRQLIDRLQELFIAFVKAINIALDEKSPYTHGHCQRVPILTMLLAEAASATREGPLKDFSLTDADRLELELASLIHDCGKIATPVHVVDKSTKLETIHDRIHLVDLRCEVVKRDARIHLLEAELARLPDGAQRLAALDAAHAEECAAIDADRDFLRHTNIGGEFMSDTLQQRVRDIASRYRWRDPAGEDAPLLSAEEADKLCIARGTLSADERQIINDHIKVTIQMLEALPWPKHLKRVPEYAGGHHERMDGKGYPRGLTREQMSIPARMMAIADVFEALTARDRPYKPGKTLTEALTILGRMKEEKHIDPDLFDVFVRDKVYLKYALEHLEPEQIDDVDHSRIPGYSGAA